MKRRGFLAAVGGLLLAAVCRPLATADRKVRLVGVWQGRTVWCEANSKGWFMSPVDDPACFIYATTGKPPKRGT